MPMCNHIYHFKKLYIYKLSNADKAVKMEVAHGINPHKPGVEEVCDEGLYRQAQKR